MTVDEAERSIRKAVKFGLLGSNLLVELGPEIVASACNGVGPARWSERVRRRLTKWLWLFKPGFDVHDCEFTYANDGSKTLFDRANDHLEWNLRRLSDLNYAWYNPVRYLARMASRAIADACREFGWNDWIDSHEKGGHKKTEEENVHEGNH